MNLNTFYFFFFFCPIAVLKDCQYFLKRRGESGHPCLVLDFSKKAFSFEYYIGYGFVINSFYYDEICSLYTHFHQDFFFIISECWILSDAFPASIEMIIWVLSFCWCGVSHWLICMCWTILVNLGWIQLGRGLWPSLCAFRFSLLIFCWECFCLYSPKILACNFLL